MITKIYTILKILSMIKDIWFFVNDKMDEREFTQKIKDMKKAAKKASEGNLEDRLKGGRDVEDQINSNSRDD